MIASLLLCASGAKVTDTIRKGIIDIEPYENQTEVLMVGNVAALTGNFIYYYYANWQQTQHTQPIQQHRKSTETQN